MPRFKRFKKKKSSPVKKETLKKVVKKVNFIDKIDNCFKSGYAPLTSLGTIVGAPSTQTFNNVATGLLFEPTAINLATGSNNARLRNQIQLKNFHMRYHLQVSPLSNVGDLVIRTCYKVRIMVVFQKIVGNNQSNTVTLNSYPMISQLLYVNTPATSNDLLSHRTWVNTSNLRVLYDKFHFLDPIYRNLDAGAGIIPLGTGKRQAYGTISLNLSKLPPIKYMGATGDTQISSGRLMVIAFSDNVNANTNPILIDADYLLKYDN